MHDTGEKLVLGHRIKAGGGIEDGEQVLDILASHPSTATFIATELARRFVADTPPAAVVERARQVPSGWRRPSGSHARDSDIARVLRAGSYRAKMKTPFDFVVSALRATGADIRRRFRSCARCASWGMPLYFCQPPTGYRDTAEAWVNRRAHQPHELRRCACREHLSRRRRQRSAARSQPGGR